MTNFGGQTKSKLVTSPASWIFFSCTLDEDEGEAIFKRFTRLIFVDDIHFNDYENGSRTLR